MNEVDEIYRKLNHVLLTGVHNIRKQKKKCELSLTVLLNIQKYLVIQPCVKNLFMLNDLISWWEYESPQTERTHFPTSKSLYKDTDYFKFSSCAYQKP